MKFRLRMAHGPAFLALLLFALLHLPTWAQPPATERPSFPRSMGFGANTRAGTNGIVLRVTNLDPEGPGSLRAAIETPGERLVVFDVGGIIDLDRRSLDILHPDITIAGQTAPSPGITIIRGGLTVRTHDVLIQHLRIRPGDAGQPKKSGWEVDGLSVVDRDAWNVVIDHCSISWATDENVSVSGPRHDGPDATARRVTFSNCIIAEALDDSTHAEGRHSKGALIHDYCREVALIGNLFAHNADRNPYAKAFTTGVIVNNVIYNPGLMAAQVHFWPPEWRGKGVEPQNGQWSIVGNVYIQGTNTRKNLPLITSPGDIYIEDNLAVPAEGSSAEIVGKNTKTLAARPVWPGGLKPLPAAAVVDDVLKNAGARPWDRDAVDQRILREFHERGGRIIDSQEEVGGYPGYAPTRRVLPVPDSQRREWLSKLGETGGG